MGYTAVHDALESRGLIGSAGLGHIECPAHDDAKGSLSLSEGPDDKALVYCHAGCSAQDVMEALGLGLSDLYSKHSGEVMVCNYVYRTAIGTPLYRVSRYEPKTFSQERWEDDEWKPGMRDVIRVPYRLDEWGDIESIYIVEGEKDADRMWAEGYAATTFVGGAGKWREEYGEWFRNFDVTIIADNDEPGREGATKIADALGGIARSVRILHSPIGKDVSNLFDAGGKVEDLIEDNPFEEWDPWNFETTDDEWLWRPYVPKAGRVLVYGASGSLKSLWAAWIGAHLAAEGKKVAYFSLEMNKAQYAKRTRQLPDHPHANMRHFGKFMFGQDLQTAIANFEGWDLLIVDSWSQAQGALGSNDNDGVSRMDAEFFQPLIKATGATVLILDNTGKDGRADDGTKIHNDEARGASRKKDIQETAWWLHRPDVNNNFRTRIENRKMRLNEIAPAGVTVETPQDRIEFYLVDSGVRTSVPMWEGMRVNEFSHSSEAPDAEDGTGEDATSATSSEMTISERLAFAKLETMARKLQERVDRESA